MVVDQINLRAHCRFRGVDFLLAYYELERIRAISSMAATAIDRDYTSASRELMPVRSTLARHDPVKHGIQTTIQA